MSAAIPPSYRGPAAHRYFGQICPTKSEAGNSRWQTTKPEILTVQLLDYVNAIYTHI